LHIKEATYLKDADMFGKQDPFCDFTYGGKKYKTAVQDDAGKKANFNEKFELEDLHENINESLIVNSYDEDPGSVDFLGAIKPIPIATIVKKTGVIDHGWLDLFDKKGKKAGQLSLASEFIFNEPDVPKVKRDQNTKPLNKKCRLEIKIIEAKFKKDADMFGK
jgi:Ca2+-dependent lipid-binding protein